MRRLRSILIFVLLLTGIAEASAQFKEAAFQQNYGADKDAPEDSVEILFSLKDYFGGLAHKNELKIGALAGGSAVFIGGQQIYNKQYWKLPVIYGALGTSVAMGFHYKNTGNKKMETIMFAAGGLAYWGTMMDGVINYKKGEYPQAGKATLYALLVPGLGQIYNKEYWKVPIYWGCLAGAWHFLELNNTNYQRFKRIHNEATTEGSGYEGTISESTALYYRDVYRRYRDYSIVALVGFYLLQAIDANVFASMQDFKVDEDLSMRIAPTVITPDNNFALNTQPAFGLSLGFRF